MRLIDADELVRRFSDSKSGKTLKIMVNTQPSVENVYTKALEDFAEWLNKNNITFHQWNPEHNRSVWVSFERVIDDFKNKRSDKTNDE